MNEKDRYELAKEKVLLEHGIEMELKELERITKYMAPKYNAIIFTVTKQVTQDVVVLLSDEDVQEISNNDGEMDVDSFNELHANNRAFYTNGNTEETIHSVEMQEESEES